MQHREIFSPKYFREIAKQFHLERDVPDLAAVRQRVADWQISFHNKTILKQSEIQLQKEFLQNFFADCLGYRTKIGRPDWELDAEFTTAVDGTRADGYLGFFSPDAQKTVAVIELKDATTDLDRPQNRKNDRRTPIEQAFSYVPKLGPDCRWVIVSNFVEIRLYHAQDQSRYELFNITQLHDDEQLRRFIFLLHRDHLLPAGQESKLDFWHRQRLEQEQSISLDFYKKFKETRLRLFEHLRQFNPSKPELLLFEKTQKLLDRLIFVFFCEDKGLLPLDMTRKVVQAARASLDPAEGQAIWQQLKGLFRSIDKGNPPQNINRYNGGLFAPDAELDELQIGDGMAEVLLALSNFDFDSDLDVNILGHIFEQSISDIEEIKASLAGIIPEKKQGKRKKDGIFYTPEYITRYIVREAVGGWLDERKRALGFYALPELSDTDLASVKMQKGRPQGNANAERHRAFWTAYREALAGIKVLDPACGSGAFLVQVFDYLSAEGQAVNDELARLSLGLRSTDDLSRNILTNNIFGVDINAESVEITRLSLWLKTADNQSELTALDRNIRCGNSLIDDPAVAGALAFDWKAEFDDIFQEKGGFDVVVGNPPYVRPRSVSEAEVQFLKRSFKSAENQIDLYQIFIERGISLLGSNSLFSFIVPNAFLANENSVQLRRLILENFKIDSICDCRRQVFADADVEPLIFVFEKSKQGASFGRYLELVSNDFVFKNNFNPLDFHNTKNNNFVVTLDEKAKAVFDKVKSTSKPLSDFYEVITGVKEYQVGKGTPPQTQADRDNSVFNSNFEKDGTFLKELRGKNVKRYRIEWTDEYLSYGPWIAEPRESRFFEGEKLLIRQIPGKEHLIVAFTSDYYVVDQTAFIAKKKPQIEINSLYTLCLLNSKLMFWFFRNENNEFDELFPKIKAKEFKSLPIKELSPDSQAPFISAADKMLALHRELHEHKRRFLALVQAELGLQNITRNLENWETLDFAAFLAELSKQKISLSLAQKSEWLTHFEQQRARALSLLADIQTTDRQIDDMVFDLYGLTAEERALVRGA
jgi:type I restriction-modification system DNA methylase subunit